MASSDLRDKGQHLWQPRRFVIQPLTTSPATTPPAPDSPRAPSAGGCGPLTALSTGRRGLAGPCFVALSTPAWPVASCVRPGLASILWDCRVFVRISKGMSEPRFAWASLVQGPVRADTLPVGTPPRRALRRGRGWRGLRHAVSLPEPQEAVARSSPDDWTGEAVKVSFASPPRRKAGAGRGFWGSRTGQGRCSRSAAEGQAEVSH